nr:MAG TPA: hypothetical protein [Caudoviricetes sp.]
MIDKYKVIRQFTINKTVVMVLDREFDLKLFKGFRVNGIPIEIRQDMMDAPKAVTTYTPGDYVGMELEAIY